MSYTLASLPSSVALAVFPELCITGYDLDVAEEQAVPVPGNLTDRLVSTAAEHGVTIVAGIPERDDDDRYNSLVTIDRDGVRDTYRKQQLWGKEADVFAAGTGPMTVETAVGTVGFVICYDINFPEIGLEYARRGCDILAASAAWRTSYNRDWRLLLRARALDGPYYVVGSNHTGDQHGRDHAGHSLIADPFGTVLSEVTEGIGHAVATVNGERLKVSRDRNPVAKSRGWS